MNKNFAKVQLSPEEMRLVSDPAWILTKNSVMGKVVRMFAELSSVLRLPPRTLLGADRRAPGSGGKEPKISKGENYKGLPWVMLDYPRVFGKEDVCAIRIFFLWGYAFSVMLHLKGIYKERVLSVIAARRAELADAGFEMSISDDEWAHEHTAETYGAFGGDEDRGGGGERGIAGSDEDRGGGGERGIAGSDEDRGGGYLQGLAGRPWLKLSARVGLEHWDEAPEKLFALHQQLMEMLSDDGDR